MSFQLIDSGWQKVMDDALKAHHADLRVVSPFVKTRAAERLLAQGKPRSLRVITRFNLGDFYRGVSDTAALRLLLDNGAEIRGVKHLHAKLYLFGTGQAISTSANLTHAGLTRNHEFGFSTDEPAIVATCGQYFDNLWAKAGPKLTDAKLTTWEAAVSAALSTGPKPPLPPGLGDEGADVGLPPPPVALSPYAADASQWFVKFFGRTENRADRATRILDELARSGAHWACAYPDGKRPRSVEDGAVMFIGRLVRDPHDIVIYGRAIGMRHRPGLDDATPADIAARAWKGHWRHYVRVHHPEFVAGTLANGVSLEALKAALGANSFAATQRNAATGSGNTDPNRAYLQQPAVELTPEGAAWIEDRLVAAFELHGTLTPTDLDGLDKPSISGPMPAATTT